MAVFVLDRGPVPFLSPLLPWTGLSSPPVRDGSPTANDPLFLSSPNTALLPLISLHRCIFVALFVLDGIKKREQKDEVEEEQSHPSHSLFIFILETTVYDSLTPRPLLDQIHSPPSDDNCNRVSPILDIFPFASTCGL